jgi:hypothetical protein
VKKLMQSLEAVHIIVILATIGIFEYALLYLMSQGSFSAGVIFFTVNAVFCIATLELINNE